MGAELLLYPAAIGSEPQAPDYDSRRHWQRVMQGHAAANMVPVVAANRVGHEQGDSCAVDFYGSSFITDGTGEIVEQAPRQRRGGGDRRVRPGCAGSRRAPPGACSATVGPICTYRS